MRTRATLDRRTYLAMLVDLDADAQNTLARALAQWEDGDTCLDIDVSLDSLGRLDSESSPRPAIGGTVNRS
ncbi:MAG TPA: hypothetical protein VMX97_06960 [Hyphomicrobiaceae bacterium]|nr:hypothetical protein [Hyphomicrobiaceae bacterium]